MKGALSLFRAVVTSQIDWSPNVSDWPSGGFGFQYRTWENFRGFPHLRARCQTRTAVKYGHTFPYFFRVSLVAMFLSFVADGCSLILYGSEDEEFELILVFQNHRNTKVMNRHFEKPPVTGMLRFTCVLSRLVSPLRLAKLTFLCRNYFFLILAHPVYKMWIIQEPNTLELWNKLHFEEKRRRVYTNV